MPEEEKFETREILYARLVLGKGDRRLYGYADVTDHGDGPLQYDDNILWFTRLLTGRGTPGSVWEMQVSVSQEGKTTIVKGRENCKFLRHWHDRDQVLQWQIEAKAVNLEMAEKRTVAKRVRRDFIKETLRPFARAYKRATPRERTYILAFVVQTITGG